MRYLIFSITLLFRLNTGFAQTPAPEICNNGLDDDGDGLIDCYDTADCPCASDHDCTIDTCNKPLELDQFWQTNTNFDLSSGPIVGNLNPWADSISEIMIPAKNNGNLGRICILKGDGSNKNNPDFLPIGVSGFALLMPAIADLDRNGVPDLFVICADKKIRVYTNYTSGANPPMELWATSVDTCQSVRFFPYSADFDGDGISEIYAGNEVFGFDLSNPATPILTRLAKGTGPVGEVTAQRFTSSIAADLLTSADCNGDPDCDGLEIAAGYGIYSVDIDPNDGDGMQLKLQRNINTTSGQAFSDGFTSVADLNHDNILEVVVSEIRNLQVDVYVWNKTGFWRVLPANITVQPFTIVPGSCSIGNVFDDRTQGFAEDWPEVILRYQDQISCFNLHPASSVWWSSNTVFNISNSGYGVASTYDFDNNGLAEIIVMDRDSLRICYGGSAPFPAYVNGNRTITGYPCGGVTGHEIPILADVDGNGNPEIIVHNFMGLFGTSLRVIHPKNPDYSRWLPARNMWNQYAYHVVNINDDLTVPSVQQSGFAEMPGPGSGKRPLNTFLAQVPAYRHPDATPYFPSADLSVKVNNVICQLPTFQVELEICNLGDRPSADTTKIRFYRAGDPFSAPASNSIGTFTLSTQPLEPDSCYQYTVTLPNAFGNIYAVVNDWGYFPTPLPAGDVAFYRPECDLQNNIAIFKMELSNGLPVSVGPDRIVCGGETINLDATPGFVSYLWQNGATVASIQVAQPGLYWVETKDLCFNTRRDSLIIIEGEDIETIQTAVCEGEFFSFEGQNILAGTTQTFVYTNAVGCDSTIFVKVEALGKDTTAEFRQVCAGDSTLVFGSFVLNAGVFSQTMPNFKGCDSLHTITIALFPAPAPSSETQQICPGDSTLVFGSFVKTAGVYAQNFPNTNGCDSTHSIIVNLLPAPIPTNEIRQICPGDSTLVFGNFVKTAGVFTQNFANTNGCDSIHSVTVSLFSAPIPTSEIRQICPGDSTLIFGNFVKTAGVFAQNFANTNGCDSTHSVTVSLLPAPIPTSEIRQICPGDSTLVFGNFVKTAGVFAQNFTNTNGCDSTHSITVSLFSAPIPTIEIRQICPGDSTLVFGNFVKTAGVFAQNFPNTNGCDSTHSVTVSLYSAPIPTSEIRQICPGDSTLVFGDFVKTAGVFAQNFANANGCDSTHSVTVNLLPAPIPSNETRQICPGDSTLVFGSFVKTAGVFTQSFPNATGCDSLHNVTVSLFSAPNPTSETRQICPGDSTLVFGNFVKTAGIFAQNFVNTNGCDSTHSITVSLFQVPIPTSEIRQICPGDSTLIFGNFVKTAGIFAQNFANINGCDSTHSITVSIFQSPVPTNETRQICTGDSTLVFGNFVNTPGIFAQSFANANGCDSLHMIEVLEVSMYTQADSVTLCPGDSVLVFGNWIRQSIVIQEIVPGFLGCDTLWSIAVQAIVAPTITLQITQPNAQHQNGMLEVTGGSVALYSLDGLQYDPQTIFDSLPAGSYVLYQAFEGCIQEAPFVILPFLEELTTGVFVPNIFAPGSSNGNAQFTVYASPGLVNQLSWLRIYDRWGALVFEQTNLPPNDESRGWDGLIGGQRAAPGVYFWQAMVEYSSGAGELKKGDLTVIR